MKFAGDDNLVRDPQRTEPQCFRSRPQGHSRLRGNPRTGVHDVHSKLQRYPSRATGTHELRDPVEDRGMLDPPADQIFAGRYGRGDLEVAPEYAYCPGSL